MFTPTRLGILPVAAALSLAAVAGCSDDAVTVDDLEQQVSDGLARESGWTPASVDCPEDLDAEVDATTRCVASDEQGNELGVTVTVEEVDGDTVNMSFQADDELMNDTGGEDPAGTQDPAAEDQATAEDPAAGEQPAEAGGDTGTPGAQDVAASDVEQQIASAAEQQIGEAPQSVSCPDDLSGTVGASMTCTTTDPSGAQHDTYVEVTSAEGGVVNFDIEIEPA